MTSYRNNVTVGPSEQDRGYSIVLPCEPDQFSGFIAGLLGRPQTIQGYSGEPFSINRADIESLYQLVNQRVFSQNKSTLISFTAKIAYDDGSSVTLNSYDDFISYNEIRPLSSKGIHLSWILLIKFNDKQAPEKQQIDISFMVGEKISSDFPDLIEFPVYSGRIFGNRMFYRINHTNRTWGTDIQSLISNYIKLSAKPLKGARAFISSNAGKIGFSFGALILCLFIASGIYVTGLFVETYLVEARKLAKLPSSDFKGVSSRLDFLVNVIASGLWSRYTFYGVAFGIFALIASVASALIVANKSSFEKPSFILLTPKSIEEQSEYNRKLKNDWVAYSAYVIGSLVLSILGSFLFYLISKKFDL